MQQNGPSDKARHFLNQMCGQDHRFVRLENAEQNLIKILAVENIVSRKRLVHQDIIRALRQGHDDLKLVFLPGREAADGLVHRKLKEVHQALKTPAEERLKVLLIKFPVGFGGQGGEEAVLTRGEGKPADVLPRDQFAVQRNTTSVI